MELPGVTRRQVESLGRQNSQLAIQVGEAKGLKTRALVNTLDHITTTFDEAVVKPNYEREAIAQYAKAEYSRSEAMAETEAILNNPTGMVDANLIPDAVDYRRYDKDVNGLDVRRTQIPAHEVAGDWYKLQLRNTQDAALAEMTNAHAVRKVKNDYNSSFMDNYARVLVNAQKQKLTYDRAELDVSVEKFIEGGNLGKAETLMLGAIKTGTIGVAEGTETLIAMPGQVDNYRVQRAIDESDLSEVDSIRSYIYRDSRIDAEGNEEVNPLTFDQRNALIKQLDAKQKVLTSEYKTGRTEWSERNLNDRLVDLQESREPLDEFTLRGLSNQLNAADHQTLIAANKALKSAMRGESDDGVLSGLQKDINSLSIPVRGQTASQRRRAMMARVDKAIDDELINGDDGWTLIQRIQTSADMAFDGEDMDLAIDQIYKKLTRGSKSSIGLNTDGQAVLNAAQAERDLFDAARAAGPGFDPLRWLDDNFSAYQTKTMLANEVKLEKSIAKGYIVKGADGRRFDETASRQKLSQAIKSRTISDAVAKQALILIDEQVERRDNRPEKDDRGFFEKLWN